MNKVKKDQHLAKLRTLKESLNDPPLAAFVTVIQEILEDIECEDTGEMGFKANG